MSVGRWMRDLLTLASVSVPLPSSLSRFSPLCSRFWPDALPLLYVCVSNAVSTVLTSSAYIFIRAVVFCLLTEFHVLFLHHTFKLGWSVDMYKSKAQLMGLNYSEQQNILENVSSSRSTRISKTDQRANNVFSWSGQTQLIRAPSSNQYLSKRRNATFMFS